MIVVADSSPLITLARIGHFDLLRRLYGRVTVPLEVYDEVVLNGQGLPGCREVSDSAWIDLRRLRGELPPRVDSGEGRGRGETAAIEIAIELNADLLLLDEWKARRIATKPGLPVAGCIAVKEDGFRKSLVGDLQNAYRSLLRMGCE